MRALSSKKSKQFNSKGRLESLDNTLKQILGRVGNSQGHNFSSAEYFYKPSRTLRSKLQRSLRFGPNIAVNHKMNRILQIQMRTLPRFIKNRHGEWFCWLAEFLPPHGMVIRGPGWSSISPLMRGRHRCDPYVTHPGQRYKEARTKLWAQTHIKTRKNV